MVSLQTLTLVKKAYCQGLNIPLPNNLSIRFYNVEEGTRNGIFFIDYPDATSVVYVHEKMDVTGYTAHRSLDIPASDRNAVERNPSPDVIASWVNRFTNIDLMGEDISKLVLKTDSITVVISPNSMRFKNSFQLTRL